MYTNQGDGAEAVLFFAHSFVVKEMLMAEFEAILDGVVELNEFAGQSQQAVYVTINSALQVTAAVFFTIEFDASGEVNRSWNLPLRHMSQIAGAGPDLGAGPIRLACRSQCPVPWHQQKTWDPVLKPEANSFNQIRQSIANNRLGLIATAPAVTNNVPSPQPMAPQSGIAEENIPTLMPEPARPGEIPAQTIKFSQSQRDRVAGIIKQLRLSLQVQANRHRDTLQQLQQQEMAQRQSMKQHLQQAQELLELEKNKNQQLKNYLSEQSADYQQAREQFMERLAETRELEEEQIENLKQQFEQELKASLDKEVSPLKEMLEMREVELFYREEQISSLHQEVSELRQQLAAGAEADADSVLERMKNAGLTFVAFHPGVGHISVPGDDMQHYLESPTAYAASKAFVDEEHYLKWMKHFYNPVCTAKLDHDEPCLEKVNRIDKPADFRVGEHDRCSEHLSGHEDFNVAQTQK